MHADVPLNTNKAFPPNTRFLKAAILNAKQKVMIMSHKESPKKAYQPVLDYRDIFLNALIGIFTSTPEGRLVDGNPALARIFGYETPRAMMDSITDIATQLYADPADRRETLHLIEEHGEITDFECPGVRRDGSAIWTSYTAKSTRDEHGNIVHYQGLLFDFTDRKRAEAEHMRLITAIKQSAEGIFLTDTNWIIQYANPALEKMLGYDKGEITFEAHLATAQKLESIGTLAGGKPKGDGVHVNRTACGSDINRKAILKGDCANDNGDEFEKCAGRHKDDDFHRTAHF